MHKWIKVVDLNGDNENQGLHHYPFMRSLDRYNRNRNSFDDLSRRIYVPNKTVHVNLNIFNMMTKINELKSLITYSLI